MRAIALGLKVLGLPRRVVAICWRWLMPTAEQRVKSMKIRDRERQKAMNFRNSHRRHYH